MVTPSVQRSATMRPDHQSPPSEGDDMRVSSHQVSSLSSVSAMVVERLTPMMGREEVGDPVSRPSSTPVFMSTATRTNTAAPAAAAIRNARRCREIRASVLSSRHR